MIRKHVIYDNDTITILLLMRGWCASVLCKTLHLSCSGIISDLFGKYKRHWKGHVLSGNAKVDQNLFRKCFSAKKIVNTPWRLWILLARRAWRRYWCCFWLNIQWRYRSHEYKVCATKILVCCACWTRLCHLDAHALQSWLHYMKIYIAHANLIIMM